MKRTTVLLFAAALLMFSLVAAILPYADTAKMFAGKITYNITTNVPPDHPYAEMMPREATYTIHNEKIRMDVTPSAPGAGAIYLNAKDLTMRMLLELPDNKLQVIMDEEYKLRQQDNPEIRYMDETKKIAGYKCHKALVITEIDTTEIWYTPKLTVVNGAGMWPKLKGFPLAFTMNQQGTSLSYVASKVEEAKIANADVEVPAGYQAVTMEELQQLIGGY